MNSYINWIFVVAMVFSITTLEAQKSAINLNEACCDKAVKTETIYSKDGQLIETRSVIDFQTLPAQVQKGFNHSFYHNWTIERAFFIQQPENCFYRLIISYKGEKFELAFDQDGYLIPDDTQYL